jgi:hypothetical protein
MFCKNKKKLLSHYTLVEGSETKLVFLFIVLLFNEVYVVGIFLTIFHFLGSFHIE